MNNQQGMVLRHGLIALFIIGLLSLTTSRVLLQNNSDLVFVAEIGGNRDIYSMAADGTNIQRLTDDPAEESAPVWSPDHRQIAFVSNRTGDFEIFVMSADGSNEINISRNSHYNSAPAWSPDGRKLLFISAGTRSNDIYIMNPDGSDPVAIMADAYDDLKAIFGPDGRSVFYISQQEDHPPALYVMDISGQNARALLSDANEEYDAPTLAPDGQRLAYVVTRFDTQGNTTEIYTSDLNGQQVALVTSIDNAFVTSLSWSPQGDQLVYALTDTRTKYKQLYTINVGNGGSQILSEESTAAYDVSWSSFEGIVSDINLVDNVNAPITCDGVLPSRLIVGQQGRVIPKGVPNRWREEPSLSAQQIGSLDLGDQFTILDGPVCQDGFAWWFVERNGKKGWTVEGTESEYWLEPWGS